MAEPANDGYANAVAQLLARQPESIIAPSLDRMRAVVELLGDPQRSAPAIHITGTNGKTSTARMIDSLLRAFGVRTGAYTSPHLTTPRERILLEGQPIDTARFAATYLEVAPYLDLVDERARSAGEPTISFFEAMTVLAFACFADAPIEAGVIEVGLGGRWDATNVLDAAVAVITPIALDHMEYLGPDLTSIASEKAGIIKAGSVAILAQQDPEVATVLLREAVEVDATVAREGMEFGVRSREVAVGGQLLTLQGLGGIYEDVFLPLHGPHQAHNAVLALTAVEAFFGGGQDRLDPESVGAGFAAATSPGRLEVVRRSPTVILDAAHNPAGARALAAALNDAFTFDRLVGVVAILADKDAVGVLGELEPVLDHVVITASASPRALAAQVLGQLAVEIFGADRVSIELSLVDAIAAATDLAEAGGEFGGVVVTGSVTTVGQARDLLTGDR